MEPSVICGRHYYSSPVGSQHRTSVPVCIPTEEDRNLDVHARVKPGTHSLQETRDLQPVDVASSRIPRVLNGTDLSRQCGQRIVERSTTLWYVPAFTGVDQTVCQPTSAVQPGSPVAVNASP